MIGKNSPFVISLNYVINHFKLETLVLIFPKSKSTQADDGQ